MKRWHKIPLAAGILLLVYSGSFALFNGLKYSLGFRGLWNPFDLIVGSQNPAGWQQAMEVLVVVGPVIALFLFFLPHLRVDLQPQSERLATITILKGNRLSLVLIGVCLVLGLFFAIYFLGENWTCLINARGLC